MIRCCGCDEIVPISTTKPICGKCQDINADLLEACKELLANVRKQGAISMFGADKKLIDKVKQTISKATE